MTRSLSSEIYACEVGAQMVLLDLRGDRFFLASPRLQRALQRLLERSPLDIASQTLLRDQGIDPAKWDNVESPEIVVAEGDALDAAPRDRSRLAVAIVHQARAAIALKFTSLEKIIGRVRETRANMEPNSRTYESLGPTAAAFRASAKYFPSDQKCLRRSIALARYARRHGHDVTLYIGVKLQPFAAHCWVQDGAIVLNDSIDEVRRFTPIMAV
ncbi:lasso peptide biosynthesis B2 protein [Brevundimonas diminuta]|jgi:hypothetical protein|uniref:Lasso peptide biosynthesis B2 protein n=1 Tax=Brevundimonas diminuta TaxID=293 RepID=A0A410NZI7_BREDI|nr:lasso peptide biosynthesis B2 protein [Brevundimonas diminuta]QAT15231.1 lasso peptide biosynthesis B2 protein [Brevundimonas diminuta]GEC00978.1 hypothetical protein BDI01nite_20420 [Brevundimonas diminuta]